MKLNTQLERVLYGSPLHRIGGRIALAALLIGLFVSTLHGFQRYYLAQPVQMLAGLVVTAVLLLPTILALLFFDRREREAKPLFWGVPLAIIFFFGPAASRILRLVFDSSGLEYWQFVGFIEEPTKILPLLLLLVFARPAINGVRDGLIYGALGGLGFGILEGAAYFALVDYPELGWRSLFTETMSRASLLGTDIHTLFSATIGAAIGYGVSTKKRWLGITVSVGVFLLVALTHGQQDHALGKTLGVSGAQISFKIVSALATLVGRPIDPTSQGDSSPLSYLILSLGSAIAMIGINLINLVILFVAMWTSGDTERRIVREQLRGEPESVITPEEYAGVEAERRLHLRLPPGYPKNVARKIRSLQNELAFRKDFVQQSGGDVTSDPPTITLRKLIEAERGTGAPGGTK